MHVRSVSIACAAALLCGALGWLAWSGRGERAPATASGGTVHAPNSTAPESGIEEPSANEESFELTRAAVPQAAAVSDAEEDTEQDVATVRVLVRSVEDGAPLAGFSVNAQSRVAHEKGTVWSSLAREDGSPTTDEAGHAELPVPSGETLRILVGGRRALYDSREIEPLVAGQVVELVFEFQAVEDVILHGRLVDAASEVPLAGTVTIEQTGEAPRSLETDSGGRFELHAGSSERAFASARVADYARTVFPVARGHEDPTQPLLVRLSRAASVEAVVSDRAGAAIDGARVEIVTESYNLQQQSSFMLDFYSSAEEKWRGKTDSAGRATITDLVPRAPLRISAYAKGWPRRDEPEPIELEPGEHRRIELVLGAGATIRGSLVDGLGAPIPDRPMWRMAASWPKSGMFEIYEEPIEKAKTDAAGRFQFDAVPGGEWWIGPAPQERVDGGDIPALAQLVSVIDELAEMEIVIRVERGLFVTGEVLDPAGQPVSRCYVSAAQSVAHADTETDEGGEFSIGPLVPGEWTIHAGMHQGAHAPSESMKVEAGQSGIVLHLRAGGSIAGEVVDALTQERTECELMVSGSAPESSLGTSSRDGTIRFEGLLPGTYSVSARTRGGTIGIQRGITVEAGARVDGVRVEVAPGPKLELSYEGAAEFVHCTISSNGIPLDWATVSPNQPQTVTVLPGTVEVRWRESESMDTEHVDVIEIAAGERRELRLRAGPTIDDGH